MHEWCIFTFKNFSCSRHSNDKMFELSVATCGMRHAACRIKSNICLSICPSIIFLFWNIFFYCDIPSSFVLHIFLLLNSYSHSNEEQMSGFCNISKYNQVCACTEYDRHKMRRKEKRKKKKQLDHHLISGTLTSQRICINIQRTRHIHRLLIHPNCVYAFRCVAWLACIECVFVESPISRNSRCVISACVSACVFV